MDDQPDVTDPGTAAKGIVRGFFLRGKSSHDVNEVAVGQVRFGELDRARPAGTCRGASLTGISTAKLVTLSQRNGRGRCAARSYLSACSPASSAVMSSTSHRFEGFQSASV